MTTDTQLVRRIRAALDARADELAPMPDMLQRLRALPAPELPPVRRSRGRIGGGVAALVSTAVVVAVVIVIGAIGHTDHRVAPGSAASIPEKGLISRLAVLRRPQHPSDRLPAAGAALLHGLHVDFDPKLTRLAVSMTPEPHGTSRVDVYVIVTGGVGRRAGYSFASVRTLLVAISQHGRYQFSPSGLSAPGAAAFAQDVSAPMGLAGKSGIRVGIVPDGVARVKWVLTGFPTSTASPVTVSPRVQNNVAIATGVSGDQLVSATWYGPGGRVIASFSRRARIDREEVAQARLIARSVHEPIARGLVEHFSVFGQPPPRSAPIKPLPGFARAEIAANPQQLNLDQARFVQYPGMPGFWLVPGRLGAAIATSSSPPGLSTDGAPLNRVLDGRMVASVGSAPPRETVYGLVPDGNPTVAIKLADGKTKTVRVIDNLYAVTLTQRPTTLTAKNAAGQTVSVRVPG